MMRWVLLLLLVGGCASGATLERAGGFPIIQPDEEDELRAYSPEVYLTQLAGHGVGGGMDLSAACGCAETGSSSPSSPSGPSVTPGVEHKGKIPLHITVTLPPMPK
jgi:hypothetical protein